MKVILETAGVFDWEFEGIFSSIEEMDDYIKKEYGITFLEYLEHHPNSTRQDWYRDNEFNVKIN